MQIYCVRFLIISVKPQRNTIRAQRLKNLLSSLPFVLHHGGRHGVNLTLPWSFLHHWAPSFSTNQRATGEAARRREEKRKEGTEFLHLLLRTSVVLEWFSVQHKTNIPREPVFCDEVLTVWWGNSQLKFPLLGWRWRRRSGSPFSFSFFSRLLASLDRLAVYISLKACWTLISQHETSKTVYLYLSTV